MRIALRRLRNSGRDPQRQRRRSAPLGRGQGLPAGRGPASHVQPGAAARSRSASQDRLTARRYRPAAAALTRLVEQKTPGLERVPGFVFAVAANNTYLTGSSVTTSEA